MKSLTTKDAALGIGRKFTDDELSEYLERTKARKAKSAAQTKLDLKLRLAQNTKR